MQPRKPPGSHPRSAGLPCSARGPPGDTPRPRVPRGPRRAASAGVFSRGVAILRLCYVTGLRSNGMIAPNTLAFTGKSEVPEMASAERVAHDTACRSEGSPPLCHSATWLFTPLCKGQSVPSQGGDVCHLGRGDFLVPLQH